MENKIETELSNLSKLLNEEKYDLALDKIEKLLKNKDIKNLKLPGGWNVEAELLFTKSEIFRKKRLFFKSLPIINKLCEEFNDEIYEHYAEAKINILLELSQDYRSREEYFLSIETLKSALKFRSDYVEVLYPLAFMYYEAMYSDVKNYKYYLDNSRIIVDRIIDLDPNYSLAYKLKLYILVFDDAESLHFHKGVLFRFITREDQILNLISNNYDLDSAKKLLKKHKALVRPKVYNYFLKVMKDAEKQNNKNWLRNESKYTPEFIKKETKKIIKNTDIITLIKNVILAINSKSKKNIFKTDFSFSDKLNKDCKSENDFITMAQILWRWIDEANLDYFRRCLPSTETKDNNGVFFKSRITIINFMKYKKYENISDLERSLRIIEKIASDNRHSDASKDALKAKEILGFDVSNPNYKRLWINLLKEFKKILEIIYEDIKN